MIGGPPKARGGRDRIRTDHLSAYDLEWSAAEEDVIPPVGQLGGAIEEIVILATGEACTATSRGPGIGKADLGLEELGVSLSAAAVGLGVQVSEQYYWKALIPRLLHRSLEDFPSLGELYVGVTNGGVHAVPIEVGVDQADRLTLNT
jgi:hypothetical protein